MRKKDERFLRSVNLLDAARESEEAYNAIYSNLTKKELRSLCDRVEENNPDAIEFAIRFFERETRGLWHNRARAMLARRFKHSNLTEGQKERILNAILWRLKTGEFFEQFKDQLRYALHTDRDRAFREAQSAIHRPVSRIIQYSRWILEHRNPPANKPG